MKMRFKFAILMPVIVLAIAADTPNTMQPGRWSTKLIFTGGKVGDQDLPADSLTQMNQERFTCVSPQDAADPQTYIVKSANKKACKVIEAPRVAGKIDFVLDCSDSDASGKISIKGDYSQSAYQGDMLADVSMNGAAIQLTGKVQASHAGVCKGDEAPG
jgi:Protein of unknown function (DUF3617)